jgi:hypothetical protein
MNASSSEHPLIMHLPLVQRKCSGYFWLPTNDQRYDRKEFYSSRSSIALKSITNVFA